MTGSSQAAWARSIPSPVRANIIILTASNSLGRMNYGLFPSILPLA